MIVILLILDIIYSTLFLIIVTLFFIFLFLISFIVDIIIDFFFFFFSSRRRHTRWNCDWSSDVCSSDLYRHYQFLTKEITLFEERIAKAMEPHAAQVELLISIPGVDRMVAWHLLVELGRSEERRVGKECRAGWAAYDEKKRRGAMDMEKS